MAPRLSICIPTYNRADLLGDCLDRLLGLPVDGSVEIVISDNASTDETPAVIAAHAAKTPSIRAHRLAENQGLWGNRMNVLRRATGEVVTFLADDDSLIPEALLDYVGQMEREPDLSAIFTDWIAWDDHAEKEMHRYFHLAEPVDFTPDDPVGLVNFVLQRNIPPEVGVYRRSALVRAQTPSSRTLPFHGWMYALSRLGRLRFDPTPFYREHRVLKPRFARGHWANMDLQLQYIGDEMRLTLETLVLLALQDAGLPQAPDDQVSNIRGLIDQILASRLALEIDRACYRHDFILAVELRRRQVLWQGPGSADEVRRDVLRVVVPAAFQAVAQIGRGLSDIEGLTLRGFVSDQVPTGLAEHYPDLRQIPDDGRRALVLHRDEATLAADPDPPPEGDLVVLSRLIDLYRTSRETVDLGGL